MNRTHGRRLGLPTVDGNPSGATEKTEVDSVETIPLHVRIGRFSSSQVSRFPVGWGPSVLCIDKRV
jgi:hypothetical protein